MSRQPVFRPGTSDVLPVYQPGLDQTIFDVATEQWGACRVDWPRNVESREGEKLVGYVRARRWDESWPVFVKLEETDAQRVD